MLVVGLVGCQAEKANPIEINLGPAGSKSFQPRTALAESLVIPGDHNELRILLAEGETSCERHVQPEEGQVLLVVTVVAPDEAVIGPGTYAWPVPAKGDSTALPPVYAIPKVHIGSRSHLLHPGGGIQLSSVDLGPNGAVRGILAFEFPGDSKSPATRIRGQFAARICRPHGRNAD